MQGIYKIINRVNGKYYVGSSDNVEERLRAHNRALKCGKNSIYLQNAWNKYGGENFIFEPIEEVVGAREALLACEQGYLDEGFEKGVLYNISTDATSGMGGQKHSKETLANMKGRIPWNKGIPRSPECIQKIRVATTRYYETHGVWNKGIPRSSKCKMKISQANSGQNSQWWGKHHTEETLQKISECKKGKKNPFYGKTHTAEARRKMGDPSRGKPKSNETRERISKNSGAAKWYPALYNEITERYIPAGQNLARMCRKENLSYYVLNDLRKGVREKSLGGWRLAG